MSSRTTGAPVSLSIHYASPEQINGEPPSPSMDIYSLGCVFYELLTGEPPFRQGDVLHQQLTKQPDPMPEISAQLNAAVLACLVKDKTRRLQSAGEVRAVLAGDKTIRVRPGVGPIVIGSPAPPLSPQATAAMPSARRSSSSAVGRPLRPARWLPLIWGSAAVLALVALGLIWQPGKHGPAEPVAIEPVPTPPPNKPPETSPQPLQPQEPETTASVPAQDQAALQRRIQALLASARQERDTGRYAEAIAACDDALRLDPGNGEAQSLRARILRAQAAESAGLGPEVEKLVAEGDRLRRDGFYDEAIAAYQKALDRQPGNTQAQRGIDSAVKAKGAEGIR